MPTDQNKYTNLQTPGQIVEAVREMATEYKRQTGLELKEAGAKLQAADAEAVAQALRSLGWQVEVLGPAAGSPGYVLLSARRVELVEVVPDAWDRLPEFRRPGHNPFYPPEPLP